MMQPQLACQHILDELTVHLSPKLTYHTVQHTIDVAKQAARIAYAEGIVDEESLTLLKTAAYYHDAGFLRVYNEHEEESCRIATQALPRFGYTPEQIGKICGIIRATRIPQTPTTQLEEIMCDADLDYLGRDDYDRISQSLLREWIAYNRLPNLSQWPGIQRSFLGNHRYFTATNQQLREPYKQRALAAI
jgi:uncharacterized protein